jgi:predicted AAA+ superfamily ATPase
MAHLDRHRYIEPQISEGLKFSPIVGVVGQRQVGKTTVVERVCKERYVTFDDESELVSAQTDAKLFLSRHTEIGSPSTKTLAIDECQLVPKLFPALKLFIQKKPRPGQFLLTGSVRFTSRKAIQESLTGRIHTIEMLPMSFSEAHRMPLGDVIKLSKSPTEHTMRSVSTRAPGLTTASIETFLSQGGLPGLCFLRQQSKRNAKFKTHIETLLQRDIQLIIQTTVPFENLRSLLIYFAANQGREFNAAHAARSTQISQATLKKLIFAFENMFLIRRLTNFGDIASPRFFLEDQGMATYLHRHTPQDDLRRFAFSQIFHQIHYRYSDVYRPGYYANRGGANINFVFEIDKDIVGVDVCETNKPNLSLLRSAESFLGRFPKGRIIFFSPGANPTHLSEQITIMPLAAIV